MREQKLKEQKLREQQLREQKIKEQQMREQKLKEQQLQQQKLKEQQLQQIQKQKIQIKANKKKNNGNPLPNELVENSNKNDNNNNNSQNQNKSPPKTIFSKMVEENYELMISALNGNNKLKSKIDINLFERSEFFGYKLIYFLVLI